MFFGVCSDTNNGQALQAAGFSFLELHVQNHLIPKEPDEVFLPQLQKIRTCGLPAYSANCFIPAAMKITGDSVNREVLQRYITTVFTRAKEAGIKTIVFGAGAARRVPEGFSHEKAWEQLLDFSSMTAAVAQANDCIVAVEPLYSGETNILLSVSEGAKLVRAVNHPNLRLLVDAYHWKKANDTVEAILENHDIIHHVHISTYTKRLAPGLELCDFSHFVNALRRINYRNGISIEATWNNMALEAPQVMAQLRRDFES